MGSQPEVIRVSIGSEPEQRVACEVLKSSILRRTQQPVEFTHSWTEETGWHALWMQTAPLRRPRRLSLRHLFQARRTTFSTWRWLVPRVYGNRGRAIYLDADQCVFADIAELWNSLPSGKLLGAVRNVEGQSWDQTLAPGDIQTSVMVLDCERCDWEPQQLFLKVREGTMAGECVVRFGGPPIRDSYAALMYARWLPQDSIAELDPAWNHFEIHTPQTKLTHWTYIPKQPYRNLDHPTAGVFESELRLSVTAGHVSPSVVLEEVRRGHLHPAYLRCVG